MIQKQKSTIALLGILLLSASCISPFAGKTGGGVAKTINGGADWLPANALAGKKAGSIASSSMAVLAFDPKNHEHVFAASYDGFVYKSEDSGSTWSVILSKIAAYDFAVDPNDSNILYAGGIFANHGRLLRSSDGGKSWEEIFVETSLKNEIRSFSVNPTNTKEIILGLNSGTLIKSSDGGANWKVAQNYNEQVNRIRWEASGLYVLLKNKGLLKSTDGGQSFQELTGALTVHQSGLANGVRVGGFKQFAVGSSDLGLIYVTNERGLYRTKNAGTSWELLDLPMKDKTVPIRAVAIAQGTGDTVYASADFVIFKTLDGGSSWQTQSVATTGFINYILIDPGLPQVAYAGVAGK